MSLKVWTPWWLKIVCKVMLSRLPLNGHTWRELDLFVKGDMEKPHYAYKSFKKHFKYTKSFLPDKGFTCLELGPGDTLFSGLVAAAFGARKTYLVDDGSYATMSLDTYQAMIQYLENQGFDVDYMKDCESLNELISLCNARYLTSGLKDIETIDTHSVDLIWSQAVLEHVRLSEFEQTLREMRRILKPGGVCSHRIDLRDHLSEKLNNLRFPTSVWEKDWMAKSGFYTNRIRYSEMLQMFSEVGFETRVQDIDKWKEVPTPRDKMSKRFQKFDDEELRIKGFNVILSRCGQETTDDRLER